MPSWGYWFSGAAVKALGTVIFSVMALVGTGYNWYRAAISEEHAAEEKEQGRMANATRLITMIDTLSALDRQLDVVSKFPGEFGDIYVVHWLNALSGARISIPTPPMQGVFPLYVDIRDALLELQKVQIEATSVPREKIDVLVVPKAVALVGRLRGLRRQLAADISEHKRLLGIPEVID